MTRPCAPDQYLDPALERCLSCVPLCHDPNTVARCRIQCPNYIIATPATTASSAEAPSIGLIVGIIVPVIILVVCGTLVIVFRWRYPEKWNKASFSDCSKCVSDFCCCRSKYCNIIFRNTSNTTREPSTDPASEHLNKPEPSVPTIDEGDGLVVIPQTTPEEQYVDLPMSITRKSGMSISSSQPNETLDDEPFTTNHRTSAIFDIPVSYAPASVSPDKDDSVRIDLVSEDYYSNEDDTSGVTSKYNRAVNHLREKRNRVTLCAIKHVTIFDDGIDVYCEKISPSTDTQAVKTELLQLTNLKTSQLRVRLDEPPARKAAK